jgi:hypothetical protein
MVEIGWHTSGLKAIARKDGDGIICVSCCQDEDAIVYGDDCGYCDAGKTPATLYLRMTGLADCQCIVQNDFSAYEVYWPFGDISGKINNVVFDCAQTGSSCVWEKSFDSLNDVCGYNYDTNVDFQYDCEALPDPPDLVCTFTNNTKIDVEKIDANTLRIEGVADSGGGCQIGLFLFDIDCSGDDTCFDCTGAVTLYKSSCEWDDAFGWNLIDCSGMSVTVSSIPL